MKIAVDNGWRMMGWWPNEWRMVYGKEAGGVFSGITAWMDVEIPVSVYNTLYKAGYIEEPYFGLNSLKCEWVASRDWAFKNECFIGSEYKDRHLKLVFNGVDYLSHFFLNGEYLGRHEGMFTPAIFDITGKVRFDKKNEILAVIEKIPDEWGQIGYTSDTKTQKSRFGYKWDFSTRLVDTGIWKDVELHANGCVEIEDVYVHSLFPDDNYQRCEVRCDVKLSVQEETEMQLDIELFHSDHKIAHKKKQEYLEKGNHYYKEEFSLINPALWYPNGYGEASLYSVKVTVSDTGLSYLDGRFLQKGEKSFIQSDSRYVQFGIRKLEFIKNEEAPDNSLPYTIKINGKHVFINGWNFVPVDHMYCMANKDKYEWLIYLAKKANVNLLRVWGGGLIEREEFYDLCDKNGIMIWQEFIQSSSGLDNEAPVKEHFLKLLEETAVSAVGQKRNHVSLTIWCGGNELMDKNNIPHGVNHPNISLLKRIVSDMCGDRLFLPASGSGPSVLSKNLLGTGQHHDSHGYWNYQGVKEHYEHYNLNDCMLHSEFGVQGCSSVSTLKTIMDEKDIFPVRKENIVWKHHGAAWWHTEDEVKELFGDVEDIHTFVKCSQYIQAEGLRYIIEANRRRKFKCSGAIPWQFNEPWPNAVCTNSVEYTGQPKMAYYWVKNAYNPIHLSLKYDKIFYTGGETFKADIYADSFINRATEVDCEWGIYDISGRKITGNKLKACINEKHSVLIEKIQWQVAKLEKSIALLLLKGYSENRQVCENSYLFSLKGNTYFSDILKNSTVNLCVNTLEKNEKLIVLEIENLGRETGLFVSVQPIKGNLKIYCAENFSCIALGEKKIFHVSMHEDGKYGSNQLGIEALNSNAIYYDLDWDASVETRL